VRRYKWLIAILVALTFVLCYVLFVDFVLYRFIPTGA
jgi:hypothetical protein